MGSIRHQSGKTVAAWAFQGDCDPESIQSNTFAMEWPPKSGRTQQFPESDRAAFFTMEQAKEFIYPSEFELLIRLQQIFRSGPAS